MTSPATIERERIKMMELLYDKFHSKLFLYALTYLNDEEDARDMVGELFVQLWDRWKQENQVKEPPASYLYSMLRSRCIDKMRHEQVRLKYLEQLEADKFDTEADVQEYENTVSALAKAISELPEPGKTILHYCYFERMTYQQTADRMSLSLPMVKKHMAKMFQKLREKLKNEKSR
ncbi:MAG: sigma-70 family RNA polymerase sigma factor [Prevotella sp.]|nr:sigma-70 family RNA polymerase sigma factor [Prevotella sp.]MBR1464613.1 sigma-70 family RNA polymerase sigma factor [Prevotella sp.]